jgi:hypothetical protein
MSVLLLYGDVISLKWNALQNQNKANKILIRRCWWHTSIAGIIYLYGVIYYRKTIAFGIYYLLCIVFNKYIINEVTRFRNP